MPKNVIVIGMARSGTSLTTSIFAKKGYYVDEKEAVIGANHMNPTGFWESTSLLELNESILRSAGFPHDNTWIYGAISNEQVRQVDQFQPGNEYQNFIDQAEDNSPWVWKDPRFCYTLGSWWPLLNQSNTVILIIRRNPEAIFNSFVRVGWRKNNKADREATLERIDAHLSNAERIIKQCQIPTVSFDYEDYKLRPEMIVAKINNACDLNLTINDLGYNDQFNHNNLSGKIGTSIDRIIGKLPKKYVSRIKQLVPKKLLSKLYPERD